MNISGLRQGAVRLCYWGYAEGRERIPPHEHDFWQAEFSLSGRCLVRTDTGEFALQDHALIILAPGVRHSLVYPEPCLCHTCKFHADLPDLPRVIYRPGSPFTRGVIQAAKVILETTFPARFFGVPEGAIVLPQDRYQILMEHFLAGVLASFRQERCEQSGLLERFYQAQEQRGGPFFTVEEAAEACGYSRNHFSVLIRRGTGMCARDFLNRLRLESARQYLRYSDQSIVAIAAHLGFSSQFHFSDFFKRMTGVSPLRYRKGKSGKNG